MSDFIPCRECIECGVDLKESEPLYYCHRIPYEFYSSIKDMIGQCPYGLDRL